MLSIFWKSFLPLPLILGLYILPAHSQPEKPETVNKVRKAHRVLPAKTKLSSPEVRSVHYEELEWRGEVPEGTKFPIGADIHYTGKSYKLYPNGQKEFETNWKDGQRHGLTVYWRESGELWFKGNYKNDKREGLWVYWYDEKQKEEERRYKNGDRHGLWTGYYYNGQKEFESYFKDDNRHGLARAWHKNGQIMYEKKYQESKEIKSFAKYWNSRGAPVDTGLEAELDGIELKELEVREGIHYRKDSGTAYTGEAFLLSGIGQKTADYLFWQNDSKTFQQNFKDGKKHGLTREWNEDGNWWKYERNFKDGKRHGLYKEWHANGQIMYMENWNSGELVKDSKEWWNISGEPVNSHSESLLPFKFADGVTWDKTESREGLRYLKGSDTPYTGRLFNIYKNGLKSSELNYKDGKLNGPWITWYEGWKSSEFNHKDNKAHGIYTMWHRNGQKQGEVIYKDDEKISANYWDSKGDPVSSEGESWE